MKAFQSIATYLISKRVTSSQSMVRWFIPLREKFGSCFEESLESGEWQQHIRDLYERKKLTSEITNHLLQVTLWREEAEQQVEKLEKAGITILLPNDSDYPIEFSNIPDQPSILFCIGNLSFLKSPEKITLVGTREPSLWGKTKAGQLTLEAVRCGVTTVSGLAQGIDSIIYEKTIEYRGSSIAILPQLEIGYSPAPENVLYLSEYPPGTGTSKWQFIARNRLLAALSPVTIVVEAPLRSGTLITAELALTYGKSVYVVLPDPNEESAYGGQVFGVTETSGVFIQSLYDVFYLEGKLELLEQYKYFINKLSQQKLSIKSKDHRHLAQADLRRYLYAFSEGDLSVLDSVVVELQRFGIIKERKNKIVFNFSGYNSWPKI